MNQIFQSNQYLLKRQVFALTGKFRVFDPSGKLLLFSEQKMFKLKEDINIFADEGQTHLLYNIKADRVIDFSAKYNFRDAQGNSIGSIKRRGMRSIWKANYEVYDANDVQVFKISEESGWVKVMDALVGELPIVGMFTGYFFNPSYIIARMDDSPVARLKKQPAMFQGQFQLEPLAQFGGEDEVRVLLGALTMTLLERMRG